MIVSEKNVSDALTYLADDPHPIARARKDLTDAENECTRLKAEVYSTQSGPVKDKEAATDCNPGVVEARASVANALFDLERHRSRVRAAEMILEIWRTENANMRAAERIR